MAKVKELTDWRLSAWGQVLIFELRCGILDLLLAKKAKTYSSGLERMGLLLHNLNRDICF